MKKNYFFIFIAGSVISGLAFTNLTNSIEISKYAKSDSHIFASGPPSGKSGAPGESNCTDCHFGSVQSGAGINQLILLDANQNPVTTYTPGQTYNVAISTASAPKRGFQVSSRILSDNTKAGSSFGIPSITNMLAANNQEYVCQTSTSSTSQSGWAYSWTAPATNVGDVRFYLATNVTNNNGGSSGDVIRTSQHTFPAASGASVLENEDALKLAIGFSKNSNSLLFDFNLKENNGVYMNLVDMSGKSVFTKRFSNLAIGDNHQEVFLSNDIHDGVYFVHFFVDNKSVAKKVYLSK